MKALIVYATRYGATKGTAEEIARILKEENIDCKGSQCQRGRGPRHLRIRVSRCSEAACRWAIGVSEAEDFVKKFQKDLENKKVRRYSFPP